MAKLSKNIGEIELQCVCCRRLPDNGFPGALIDGLQELRDLVGGPIYITSGYRCPKHNKAVGGVPNSLHMKGWAADVTVPFMDPAKLFRIAEQCGFGGMGLYVGRGFIHVDVGPRARWCTDKYGKKLELSKYLPKIEEERKDVK